VTVVASGYARAENDLYQTEPWVTRALLWHFPATGMIVWEPAAGNHMMADVLKAQAKYVRTSDLVTYDRAHDFEHDFFGYADNPARGHRLDALITNPPYGKGNRQAVKFCERALDVCGCMVALLLTAKFDFG